MQLKKVGTFLRRARVLILEVKKPKSDVRQMCTKKFILQRVRARVDT